MGKIACTCYMLLLSVAVSGAHDRVLTEWKQQKKSGNIVLSYRWVNLGDTLKTREMKAVFEIQAGLQSILKNFTDSQRMGYWMAGVKECRILKKDEDAWIVYNQFDIPWPFASQDLVSRYEISNEEKQRRLKVSSVPGYIPVKPGVIRMEHYSAEWVFTPLNNGSYRLEFYSISFTKPVVPRLIQDPVVQGILIDSFSKLITLSESFQK